jgi:hypothetical protein
MITDINSLLFDNEESTTNNVDNNKKKKLVNNNTLFLKTVETKDDDELCTLFFDGTQEISTRIIALELLWNKNQELCQESSNKVVSMFMFTPTSIFRKLLTSIVLTSCLNANIKNECSMAIYDDNKNSGYDCFIHLSTEMTSFPTPLQLDIVRTLMETKKHYSKTLLLLINIITNSKLECEYRYKSLLGIQRDNDRKYIPKYLDDAFLAFVKHKNTYTRYRIIGSQYVLQHKSMSSAIKKEIEKLCIEFASDNNLDYSLRADAADLLIRSGSKEGRTIGNDIIILLGRTSGGMTTVYNDRQNVHSEKIDESINTFILEMSSIQLKINSFGVYTTFADVQSEIEKMVSSGRFDSIISLDGKEEKGEKGEKGEKKINNRDKVKSSLLRILIDQIIYAGGQTLQSIFKKVWQVINEHEYSDVLKDRMVEELIDMAETCSSGHISRIVNVLSGFNIDGKVVGINIGWKKQIQSNLIARLNATIKNIKDEDQQSKILDEMITSGGIINKPTMALFFRDNLLPIRKEMFNEFVGEGYIKSDEFEEYFRNALTFFEESNI